MSFLSLLTGSFSQGAADNPTVAMIEAAYRHHGIDARYINCEVPPEALGDAVRGARAMGWAGFNCSIPHKVAVVEHLDGLGESASVIGAVNCAVRARRPADRREHRRAGLHDRAADRRGPGGPLARAVRRRRRGARHRRRGGARRRGPDHGRQPRHGPRDRARGAPQRAHARRRRAACRGDGQLPRARGRRHRRQRHVGRSVPRRRRAARRRHRQPAGRDGGRRRDPQPAAHRADRATPRRAAARCSTASACSSTRA